MSVDDTTPTDADDVDLDQDGAPCLVCGQTVSGPGPALLCPDCAAADTTTDTGTTVAKLGGDPDGTTYRVPPTACRPADPHAATPTH